MILCWEGKDRISAKFPHTGESVRGRSDLDVALPQLVVKVVCELIRSSRSFPQSRLVSWVRIPCVRLEVCEAAIDFPGEGADQCQTWSGYHSRAEVTHD